MDATEALLQIRERSFLDASALLAVLEQSEETFESIRGWPDSGLKRDLLRQISTVIAGYRRTADEAIELQKLAEGALQSMSDDELPPLPDPDDGGIAWSTHVQMAVESTPGPIPTGTWFGRYLVPEEVELEPTMSFIRSDVPATNETVLPVKIGATLIARARFAAGSANAAIEILQPIIPVGSLVIFETPSVQDPTLSGVVGTWTARRT